MEERQVCCTTCGTALGDGQAFCTNCGTPVPSPDVAEETAVLTPPEIEGTVADVPVPVVEPTCAYCGAVIGEGQAFCVNCGAPVTTAAPMPSACMQCGAVLMPGQPFCANCGKPANAPPPTPKKKHSPAIPILIAVIAATVVAAAAIVVWMLLPRVEELRVSDTAVEIGIDESYDLSCRVTPDNAIDGDVTWRSTDDNVATVDEDGTIYAVGEGTCNIVVTAGECEVKVAVTVTDGPDFVTLYYAVVGEDDDTYLASDGSYIEIDTNVYDLDDYSRLSTLTKIQDLNDALGLPASVYQRMLETRALDGRQFYQADGFTVSWTYHPDQGLEVMYELD